MTQRTTGRVWLVTGCSSGIGRAVAEALIHTEDCAVLTARNPDQLAGLRAKAPERIRTAKLDLNDHATIRQAVEEAQAAFGRIDVLMSCAGVGLMGALEECSDEEIESIFTTNVFGTLKVVRTVLPVMRAQGSGVISTLTSVAGFQVTPGIGVYGATKCAIEGAFEALAGEVAPLGLKVMIVEPGVYRTDFRLRSLDHAKAIIPAYAETSGKMRSAVSGYGPTAGDPAKAAAAILEVVNSGRIPLRLPLGADAMTLIKNKIAEMAGNFAEWESLSMSSGGSADGMAAHQQAIATGKK